MGFKKILVALDYSELSKAVFAQALDLARANGACLMLFHGLTGKAIGQPISFPVELGLYPELVSDSYHDRQTQIDRQVQEVQVMLKKHCEFAQHHGIPAEFNYKAGEVGHLLCEAAGNWGADLIVLGRRGRTGWSEALLGSVSNHVLHHAPCSVMVIQAVEAEPAPANAKATVIPLSRHNHSGV